MIYRFISDLHLAENTPKSLFFFEEFLQKSSKEGGYLYMLGDIFNLYLGDDDQNPAHLLVEKLLRLASDQGLQIAFIAGNHDFLVRQNFCERAGITLLPDPYVLNCREAQLILTHGDILCTNDIDYMDYCKIVRNPSWQDDFLQKPLSVRKEIAKQIMQESKVDKDVKSMPMMDVAETAVRDIIMQNITYPSKKIYLIHGHTHLPAQHEHTWHDDNGGKNIKRYVLANWDEKYLTNASSFPDEYCLCFDFN